MQVSVKGVKITLTESQIREINVVLKKREKLYNSFVKVLRHYGFKKHPDTDNGYSHKIYEWYAEITIHNENWASCWMTGLKLKKATSFWDGGYNYDEPKELSDDLAEAMDKMFNIEK